MKVGGMFTEFQQQHLDGYRGKISELPTLPLLLVRLMRLLNAPRFELDPVVRVIAADQSLSARFLRLVKDMPQDDGPGLQNLHAVLSQLGQRRIAANVYTSGIIYMFRSRSEVLNLVSLWKHGYAAALCAEELARRIGWPDPELAYLGGLMHDLGIVAEIQCFPGEFKEVTARLASVPQWLYQAEQEVFGIDHTGFGYLVGQRYNLPQRLNTVLACHHQPDLAAPADLLPALIHLADSVCQMVGFDHGLPELAPVNLEETAGWLLLRDSYPHLAQWSHESFFREMEPFLTGLKRQVSGMYESEEPAGGFSFRGQG